MNVTERERREIYAKLEPLIGEEAANIMMRLLPYQPHDELATRADVHAATSRLQGEMAELRAELRGEMAQLSTELRGEMTELRAELRGDMSLLRSDVRTELAGMQRWAAGILAANAVALITALMT